MTAHKHAEIIKAKADNMDLVVFCEGNGKWIEVTCSFGEIAWWEDKMYFLCLPQYKKECLHWLNGGLVSCSTSAVVEYLLPHSEYKWSTAHHFMCKDETFVIKHENHKGQKKQKRWIGIQGNGCTTQHYATKDELIASLIKPSEWDLIEIEL